MKTFKPAAPFKWPFKASPQPLQPDSAIPRLSRGTSRHPQQPRTQVRSSQGQGGRVADVIMVIFWGASIPGLMWLGAAGGF